VKKLIQNNPRGLTAAIAVLACCTGAANATVEENKGTNAIAFSEERGDKTANLVLSTLDLAIMDPVDRDNMLASLETQYGKPKAWASRAARSTSKSVFGFARDGAKEKYGVRLRARELSPVFNSEVANSSLADNARVSEQIASASLLGVSRSEGLTWSANQDSYTGSSGPNADYFTYDSNNKWLNAGFNYKLGLGDGIYSPLWYGFSIKFKGSADLAGRFSYNQWWYKAHKSGKVLGYTRDVASSGSVGGRCTADLTVSWGHDWYLGWAGHWGLGAEVKIPIGLWPNFNVNMNSSNKSGGDDTLSAGLDVWLYTEVQGSAWFGNTKAKNDDDDIWYSESHQLVGGAKVQIVFQGSASLGVQYICRDRDWYNDKWNNSMTHEGNVGNSKADGELKARGEIKFGPVTFQNGWQIWKGVKTNAGWVAVSKNNHNQGLDSLL
jgi:hypothetical protein